MNCDDVQKSLYVYLDGEFADPERGAFERHVSGCGRCRLDVERNRRFLSTVQDSVPRPPLPQGLELRVKMALAAVPMEAPPSRPRSRGLLGWSLAAAALAGLCLLGVWIATSRGLDGERVAHEAVLTHQEDLPMEVRGSRRHIAQFLESKVPFKVELPLVDDPRVELVGARLTRLDGRDAVLFNYEVDGERLSILQVDDGQVEDEAPAENAPSFSAKAGFQVATFKRRGVTSSVVGSGGTGVVERLVRASWP
jgi:anti-sigma factor RsiW